MTERGRGGIINVSSVAAFLPRGTYAAAKAWVNSFGEWAHNEYAPAGVTVMTLCPGFTKTEFHERMGVRRGTGFMWLDADFLVDKALSDFDKGTHVLDPRRAVPDDRRGHAGGPERGAPAVPVDGPSLTPARHGDFRHPSAELSLSPGEHVPPARRPRYGVGARSHAPPATRRSAYRSPRIPAPRRRPVPRSARGPRPIAGARFAPRHPFMAANGRSNLHDDAYQSDAGPTPGPLGSQPGGRLGAVRPGVRLADHRPAGRLVTVCVGAAQITLRMLDPRDARRPRGARAAARGRPSATPVLVVRRRRLLLPRPPRPRGRPDLAGHDRRDRARPAAADPRRFELARQYDVSRAGGRLGDHVGAARLGGPALVRDPGRRGRRRQSPER